MISGGQPAGQHSAHSGSAASSALGPGACSGPGALQGRSWRCRPSHHRAPGPGLGATPGLRQSPPGPLPRRTGSGAAPPRAPTRRRRLCLKRAGGRCCLLFRRPRCPAACRTSCPTKWVSGRGVAGGSAGLGLRLDAAAGGRWRGPGRGELGGNRSLGRGCAAEGRRGGAGEPSGGVRSRSAWCGAARGGARLCPCSGRPPPALRRLRLPSRSPAPSAPSGEVPLNLGPVFLPPSDFRGVGL